MIPMTPQMRACLTAIRDLTIDGVPPSIRDLAAHLGLKSQGSTMDLLTRMKARGLIDWERGQARTLRIVDQAPDLARMSLEGLRKLIAEAEAELQARYRGSPGYE